jgi:hypothetical protein
VRPAVVVAALAVAAAVWAAAASALFVPRLTDNGDEAVYLLQAESLRAGHLFPPAAEPARAFLPWLSTTTGHHYVTKYTPVFPAFIAACHRTFGSDRAALALAAAGAVVACYLLAREVLGRRREAALAAALLAGSPLFAIQSATYLSYLFNAGLLMGFAAALLAGLRRRSPSRLALAGVLLGLAVFARPFDAVLFAGPLLGWWAWSGRHRARRLLGQAVWLTVGASLPLAAMAAYFQAATGSLLRPPFTFVGPSDTLGFGPHRMYAGMPYLDYTPARALLAFGRLTVLTGFWGFGGLLLVGLAVAGHRHLRGRAGRCLALVALTVPLGYTLFWGSFSSTEWGGPWRFGPFYWMPVLVPGSIFGAAGLARLWRWDRLVGRFVAAGMAAVSLFVVVQALADHHRFAAERDRLDVAPLRAAALDRAIVFLPPLDGPWLLQPFSLARNSRFDGPVVWALDRGARQNLDVARRFPDRTPYRVVPGATRHSPTTLERLADFDDGLVPPRRLTQGERPGPEHMAPGPRPKRGRHSGSAERAPRSREPSDDVLPAGPSAICCVKGRPVGVVGDPVQIGALGQQVLGGAPLPAGAGVPERLRYDCRSGLVAEEVLETAKEAQGGGVPRLVESGAPVDQVPGDVPAGVADGVAERRADRPVACLDVGAAVDQGGGDVDVVAARRPVQRGLVTRAAAVGVGAGLDEDANDLRPVREVAGPVGDHVERRTGAEGTAKRAGRQPGMFGKEVADGPDVAGADSNDQCDRGIVQRTQRQCPGRWPSTRRRPRLRP